LSLVFVHEINLGKFLNTLQILLVALTLISSVAFAEDRNLAPEEVFMDVLINQQPQGITFLLRLNERLFVGPKDLRRWRLRLPNTSPLKHYGEDFYALEDMVGLTYFFNEAAQALTVEAPTKYFDATILKGTVNDFSIPTPSDTGGFINYSAIVNHSQIQTSTSGMLDLGVFGAKGVGQTSILGRELGGQSGAIRLDTNWTYDQPMQFSSLRFGDVISGASSWGGAVRLGGLQWATNFSTQPGLITFPLSNISSETALPSTVDFYVNDTLRLSSEVPSGPFSIEDLPLISGQGDSRLVVRDILGREQVITQPFYTSSSLLKTGLQDYSYELGFVRRNFGTDSNNYGAPVAVGSHRKGITDRLTLEIRGELLDGQQAIGLGGVLLSPAAGVLSSSLAVSRSGKGVGGLLTFGFHRENRLLSFGAKTQLTSPRFAVIGMQSDELVPQKVSKIFVNLPSALFGSFAVTYTQKAFSDHNDRKILNTTYNRKVGRGGNLSVSLNRSLSDNAKTSIYLNFSMSLGNRIKVNTSTKLGSEQARLQVVRNMQAGRGVGYRLATDVGNSNNRQAEVSLQNDVGSYNINVNHSKGETTLQGSVNGGVAFLDGRAFLGRRINNSFAVVKVSDYSDVGIYSDNQLVARTNTNGNALITGLRAYQKNSVRIEQADLPINVQIGEVELNAVPYFRSGLLLKFPVKRSRGALLSVILDNGDPLPAGAQVEIIDENILENELFPTGMRGEVYLTGLEVENHLRVTWKEQSCGFTLPFPETTDPLPHLGTYICSGVEP
jgi:outer membrane usher protein